MKKNIKKNLSHLNDLGNAVMVDVSEKKESHRVATALATVLMSPDTLRSISNKKVPKGDVFAAARIAGILAAKKTHELIPLCHPLPISAVTIDFRINTKDSSISITSTVSVTGKTGVEMEALTAVSIAALTVYDMCKSIEKGITIQEITLLEKRGGESGIYKRQVKRP